MCHHCSRTLRGVTGVFASSPNGPSSSSLPLRDATGCTMFGPTLLLAALAEWTDAVSEYSVEVMLRAERPDDCGGSAARCAGDSGEMGSRACGGGAGVSKCDISRLKGTPNPVGSLNCGTGTSLIRPRFCELLLYGGGASTKVVPPSDLLPGA